MRRERYAKVQNSISKRRIINYIIDITLLLTIIILFFTGLIKYPPIQKLLSIDIASIPYTAISTLHDLSGISLLVLGLLHIFMHQKVLWKTTKSIIKDKKKSTKIIVALVGMILITILLISIIYISKESKNEDYVIDNNYEIVGINASLSIKNIGDFTFVPEDISTMRSDVFKNGEFSIFDIVVYLDRTKQIDADYHFEETIDSYIIDSINGTDNWWYEVKNPSGMIDSRKIFMDSYKYDNKLSYELINISDDEFTQIYGAFENEKDKTNPQQQLLILSEKLIQQLSDGELSETIILELEDAGFRREILDLIRLEMQTDTPVYKDGTYTGIGNAHYGTITVEVTIYNREILFIEVLDHNDTAPKLPEVFKLIPIEILKNQSIQDVDIISGATHSSNGYIAAVADALSKAN